MAKRQRPSAPLEIMIDKLPPRCSVRSQFDSEEGKARFQAVKHRRVFRPREYEWTDWQEVNGDLIRLSWPELIKPR